MRVLTVAPRTLMRMLMVGVHLDMLRARLMRMLMVGVHLDITLRLLSCAVPAIPPRIQLLMTMIVQCYEH
jgi:hypothetical protein